MVGPSALLVLEDVAKMCVLGARWLVFATISPTTSHNCWHIQANPGQPKSGVLYFAIGLIEKLAHPRHFVLEDVAKSAFWG